MSAEPKIAEDGPAAQPDLPWVGRRWAQCRAKSKRSGVQCRRAATPGSPVCASHGSKSPQARRAAERRLVLAEAREQARWTGERTPTDPARLLLTVVNDAAAVLARLKAKIADSETVGPEDLDVLASWMDRCARVAKAALDSGAQRHLDQFTEQAGAWLLDRMLAMAAALGHDARQRDVVLLASEVLRQGAPKARKVIEAAP